MRRIQLAIFALFALSLQGCCSVARLFCGPDRSPWVSVNFETPEQTVQTFLEALRRDHPEVAYQCLAKSFRKELEIDQFTVNLAWAKIREQIPGLHLAGYATVPEIQIDWTNGSGIVVIDVEGYPLTIRLIRETSWEVRYRRVGESLKPEQLHAHWGKSIKEGIQGAVTVTADEENDRMSKVTLLPRSVTHYGVDEIPVENVDFIGLQRSWHISGLMMPSR